MAKPKKERTTLTYGQVAEAQGIFHFLVWMQQESAPVPVDDEERTTLALRWLKHRQQESLAELQAVQAELATIRKKRK